MVWLHVTSVVAGLLLIVLTELDILATVLHPEVESPFSSRFQRLTWRILRLLARLVPQRDGVNVVLNWALPLMIVGLISIWLGLLAVGFGLLVYPWISDSKAFATTEAQPRTLVTALYYSGATLSTLGYGDVHPAAGPARMLAIVEALAGAITIAFGVAYVLGVYPALTHTRTVAAALDAEVAGQTSALPMVRRYLTGETEWGAELSDRLRELSLDLLALTEDHQIHPVLYYAHPRRVQHSFLRIVVTAQSLVGLLRYGLSPDRHHRIVRNPQLLLLEQSLHYTLRRLTSSLHAMPPGDAEDVTSRLRIVADYEGLCRELEQLGLISSRLSATQPVPALVDSDSAAGATPIAEAPVASGDAVLDPALDLASDSPVEAYVVFRRETDPFVAAYAAVTGYSLETARANAEVTWWLGGR